MLHTSTLSALTCTLFLSFACSEGDQSLGDVGQNTGEEDGGGAGGSTQTGTGGAQQNTGGSDGAGGAQENTGGSDGAGGAQQNTGGAQQNTGGAHPNTGGASPATGGMPNTGGGGNLPECIVDCQPGGSTLEWGADGGLVAYRDHSQIRPCSTRYEHLRVSGFEPATEVSCYSYLPFCHPELGQYTFGDVFLALEHADVQAALAQSGQTFGTDPRPVDGQVLAIRYGDDVIYVGGDCDGAQGCTAVPAGIQALADILRQLDAQELARGECQAIFGE